MLEPVSCAIKPMMEKITKPAKMEVAQFKIGTIFASLDREREVSFFLSLCNTAWCYIYLSFPHGNIPELHTHTLLAIELYILGATIRYLRGVGLDFLPGHFYFFTREIESFIFPPQDMLISTKHCSHHLFHPFSPQKYLFPKKLQAPQYSNDGPLIIPLCYKSWLTELTSGKNHRQIGLITDIVITFSFWPKILLKWFINPEDYRKKSKQKCVHGWHKLSLYPVLCCTLLLYSTILKLLLSAAALMCVNTRHY